MVFSTALAQLFIAKFEGDYSYMTITVVDKTTGALKCTLVWTALNEAVCKLAQGSYVMHGTD